MDKKAKIIEAAITVFGKQGLEKGKIADIATLAGIGKGTVYEYFSSKYDILEAIEKLMFTTFLESVTAAIEKPTTPTQKIETLIEESLHSILKMGDGILILTELWVHTVRCVWKGHNESYMADFYNTYRQKIIQILEEGIEKNEFRQMNTEGIATLLMAFIDGLTWQYLLLKDKLDFHNMVAESIESFMKGIEK